MGAIGVDADTAAIGVDADTAAIGVDVDTEAVTGAVVTSSGTLLSLEGTLLPDFFFLGAFPPFLPAPWRIQT